MNQREYEDKYDEIKSELRKLEEEQQDCRSLKRAIEAEEEDRERALNIIYVRNEELEKDWRRRNMIGNKDYLFQETEERLNKVRSERNSILRDDFDDLNQYMKKLSQQEEEYQEKLSKLKREYEDQKEEH
ncbi:MAG: hypothetical protein RR869_09200 [Lachnospiraceae bacterium]